MNDDTRSASRAPRGVDLGLGLCIVDLGRGHLWAGSSRTFRVMLVAEKRGRLHAKPIVMVDEVRVWPSAKGIFAGGSCHLTVNGNSEAHLEALHDFAKRIGMRRSWFQNHPRHPHYDLTPGRRAAAVEAGAVEVDAFTQARARLRLLAERRGS